jgi:hypothetical protein
MGSEYNSLREFIVKNPGLKVDKETKRIKVAGISAIAPSKRLSKIPKKVVQIIAIKIEMGIKVDIGIFVIRLKVNEVIKMYDMTTTYVNNLGS